MIKVIVRGPALTRTGYGEHCRFVLRSLRQDKRFDIYLMPVNWGNSNWLWEDNEEREWFDELVKKTALHSQTNGQYDMSIQVTIPNEWQRMAPVNIGVTAGIETDKVSPQWVQKVNEMDKVVTISEHSKASFVNTVYEGIDQRNGQKVFLKCLKDIDVVHYPVKSYDEKLDLELSTKFNFLTVAQWGPRKNLENTIQWFVEEFIDNPDVGLVVKTFAKGGSNIDRQEAKKVMNNLLARYENRKCKVYLLHGDLSDAEMHALYSHKDIHCLVSLTHGEGFGLPLFEAAYSQLPVIATNWSGHLDFLCKENKKGKVKPYFAKVDFDLREVQPFAVWDGVIQKESKWAYPQQGSYKMKLREVYKDYSRFQSQSKDLQKWILENFKAEDKMNDFLNSISSVLPQDLDWMEEIDNIELV